MIQMYKGNKISIVAMVMKKPLNSTLVQKSYMLRWHHESDRVSTKSCLSMCKLNNGKRSSEPGISKTNTGPIASKTTTILRRTLTSSTYSVVNGPPNISLAKSSLDGM